MTSTIPSAAHADDGPAVDDQAAAEIAIRRAYIAAVAMLDALDAEQLADVARRYTYTARSDAYQDACSAAAEHAYAAGRVGDVGTEDVPDDRVTDVPDEVAHLEDLTGVAGGAGLDLGLAILGYDALDAGGWRVITSVWAGHDVPAPWELSDTPDAAEPDQASASLALRAAGDVTHHSTAARAIVLRIVGVIAVLLAVPAALGTGHLAGLGQGREALLALLGAGVLTAVAIMANVRSGRLRRRRR